MMIQTKLGIEMNDVLLSGYMGMLVNRFFKILPIRESGENSLDTYMRSLQLELLGCRSLICAIHEDPMFVSLLSILQYLIDTPDCPTTTVKREVFRAISICNKLRDQYANKHTTEKGATK